MVMGSGDTVVGFFVSKKSNSKLPNVKGNTIILSGSCSVATNEQVKLYDRYLNGYFSNQEEKALTKVIDKINRVYYNDSKSSNVHVYDYIRSLQTNE